MMEQYLELRLQKMVRKNRVFRLIALAFILILSGSLNAYESEDELTVVIAGKVAKYISCENSSHSDFIITLFDYPHADLFDKIYRDKKIHSKPVKIKRIHSVSELGLTNVLYISKDSNVDLKAILSSPNSKGILTISDVRGFAQKGGVLQIYFVSQKLKLKINTDIASGEGLKIKPTLLRIADVVRGDNR